jgi:hypothetical protein
MKTYDDRHPFAVRKGARVQWIGDPARGEFLPREKRKKRRRS